MEYGVVLGVIGAVIAFVLAGTGCGVAMYMIGQAAAGVVKEDPRKFGQTLVLQAVGSTCGIYGLLMGFLILSKAMDVTDTTAGLILLLAGCPIGFIGLFISIVQARVLVSGVILVAKRTGEIAKALIFAAMVETMQIFALLFSFLIYNNV